MPSGPGFDAMRVEPLTGLDLRLGDQSWTFAETERKRIDAHWQNRVAANPKLWNGDVLICTNSAVTSGVLSAQFAQTDYASFVAWRDWGRPDPMVVNCFGSPAVITSDGALVFGVMSGHTLNRGRVYPPGGSLEPRDVTADGLIDLLGSIATELHEEAGLDAKLADLGGLVAMFDEGILAVVQTLRFPLTFAAIEEGFIRHREAQKHPELEALTAIRSASQIDSRMPGFAAEIVRRFLLTK